MKSNTGDELSKNRHPPCKPLTYQITAPSNRTIFCSQISVANRAALHPNQDDQALFGANESRGAIDVSLGILQLKAGLRKAQRSCMQADAGGHRRIMGGCGPPRKVRAPPPSLFRFFDCQSCWCLLVPSLSRILVESGETSARLREQTWQ